MKRKTTSDLLSMGMALRADRSTMYVRKAPVAEWMAEKPECTCCVLTWDW